MHAKPVTIVVPLYGDLPGVLGCIAALKATVDFTRHSLLLVNDCGPDSDAIESAVQAAITDIPQARYERNPRNLGFVGNCNRAALELDDTGNDILLLNSDTVVTPGFLDEMSAVLHADSTHGIVCARSNNATIASLPYRLRIPSAERTLARTAQVHAALFDTLPRFSVSPVSMGFCFLVRRELIDRFGLFDEIFSPGYGEENDFCLRMREHGYLSLIAHRALVHHAVGQSFPSAQRAQLRAAHERILVARHPHYTESVQRYLKRTADPVDVFADVIVPSDDTVRVLLDCAGEPSPVAAEMLRTARGMDASGLHVTLCVPERLRRKMRIKYPQLLVVDSSQLSGVWDVAAALDEHPTPGQLDRITRASPRIALIGQQPELAAWSPHELVLQHAGEMTTLRTLTEDVARATIDVPQLRARWVHNSEQATLHGIPLVSRLRLTTRLSRSLERTAPRAASALRKLRRH